MILFVADGSRKIKKADIDVAEKIKDKKVIIIINKTDLALKVVPEKLKAMLPGSAVVKISALKKKGLSLLEDSIAKMFFKGQISGKEEFLISNLRQKESLTECYESIEKAVDVVSKQGFEECLVFEIRQALDCLGTVIGDNVDEDILDNIFSRFCIGK